MRSDLFSEPGTASVRAQAGIVAEDPRVFAPYTIREAVRCADVIARDAAIPEEVRDLLRVGLSYDLRPGHLRPRMDELLGPTKRSPTRVKADRLRWESVDPILRFETVARATGMILALRARG